MFDQAFLEILSHHWASKGLSCGVPSLSYRDSPWRQLSHRDGQNQMSHSERTRESTELEKPIWERNMLAPCERPRSGSLVEHEFRCSKHFLWPGGVQGSWEVAEEVQGLVSQCWGKLGRGDS